MSVLVTYETFINEYVESVKSTIYSDEFLNVLNSIWEIIGRENNIPAIMMENNYTNTNIGFIDVDDDENDMVTISDISMDGSKPTESNSKMRIGRLVRRILSNTSNDQQVEDSKIEEFVNAFKAIRNMSNFEIVSGEDLRFWYNGENYESISGTLGSSCMRYESTQGLLDFYVENPSKVSLLILHSRKDKRKIIGRALLWKLSKPSKNKTFMDRVYTISDFDVFSFILYARKNKYMYKSVQNRDSNTRIVRASSGRWIAKTVTLMVDGMKPPSSGLYPYLDTLKFYDKKGRKLSNRDAELGVYSKIFKLEGVNGDDYVSYSRSNIDELRSRYEKYILKHIATEVGEHPVSDFWKYVDDDRFMEDYKKALTQELLSDRRKLLDYPGIVKGFAERANIPVANKNTEDIIRDIVNKKKIHSLANEIAEQYDGMVPEDIAEKEIGSRIDKITKELYSRMRKYFDDVAYARDIASNTSNAAIRNFFRNR